MARMSKKSRELYVTALRKLGIRSKELIRNLGEGVSFTLRNSVKYSVDPKTLTLTLYNPEHWAIYYHQGRSGISGPLMVYFIDPAWDPRITKGGYYNYPAGKRAAPKLTKAQFNFGMRENALYEEENPDGGPFQFMMVTRNVGPTTGVPYMKMVKPAVRREGKILMKEAGVAAVRQDISGMLKKIKTHDRVSIKITL